MKHPTLASRKVEVWLVKPESDPSPQAELVAQIEKAVTRCVRAWERDRGALGRGLVKTQIAATEPQETPDLIAGAWPPGDRFMNWF